MNKSPGTLGVQLARAASTVRVPRPAEMRLATPIHRRRSLSQSFESRSTDGPGSRSLKMARVEATLFAAGEPISTRRIADVANLADANEARALVLQLKSMYDSEDSAFTLVSLAGGWQMCTRAKFAEWLEKLHPNRQSNRLSQPALETLSVVAYRQPILRADIESIRGVSCGEMLRQLIDRGLVRITGHHDSLGRPLLYGTTRRFLELFGLADLANLPVAEQLRRPAQPRSHQVAPSAPTTDEKQPTVSDTQ